MRPRLASSGLVLLCLLALAGGCDAFTPRTPEMPGQEGGTFVQPDTPEQVVENVQASIAELNTSTYVQSFADDFDYLSADPQNPVFDGWDLLKERAYFTTLAAAATPGATHELRLLDEAFDFQPDDATRFTASYVLTVQHRNATAPTTVQGRLQWTLGQDEDGLWRIASWTDQEIDGAASWSDLKAAFAQ